MKKRTPIQNLKSISIIYITLAVIGVIFACLVNLVPSVTDYIKQNFTKENIMLEINVSIIVNIITDIWYYWLVRRFVNGKSNGTLYMVLLIIGVAGGLISLFILGEKNVAMIDFTINALALYFLLQAKKEK